MKKVTEGFSIKAGTRTTVGKKVKKLRKEGLLPTNVYGQAMKSIALQVDMKAFIELYKKAGETQVVTISVDGKEEIPTQIQNVQIHPLTRMPLHADFKKVDLKKKSETAVPIEIIGESEAVEKKHGELNIMIQELTVLALPTDIPQRIEIDISTLVEIGDEIKVGDIKTSGNYELVDEKEAVVVKVNEHVEQSTEPETDTAEAPEITDEKTPDESAAQETASEEKSEPEA